MDLPPTGKQMIIRSPRRRRTMAVQVSAGGTVTVHVPRRCSNQEVEEFLTARRDWIERTRARVVALHARYPKRTLTADATVPYLGTEYPLAAILNDRVDSDSGARATRLITWYRAEALRHLTTRTHHFAAQLGVTPTRIAVRTQHRRWGSCSPNGRIFYNWRLILCPPAVIDYVVAHEVAHLRHANHGPRFWQTVAALFPDFTAHRRWLQTDGMAFVMVV
ncbi:MAG: M48 family metallopeptidase [Deltaproteobacteria bacterium]|nr:M48 family metallopeptidase [Deltaproteobacteria bacterium]